MEKRTQSAGGLLLRRQQGCILIAVVERHRNVEPKWSPVLRQLPKGGCEGSESLESTALREVEEETGFASRILGVAGTANWSYERVGYLWHETVTYFFLEALPESMHAHDSEFDLVRWMPIEEAALNLSYPEERELIHGVLSSRSLPQAYLDGVGLEAMLEKQTNEPASTKAATLKYLQRTVRKSIIDPFLSFTSGLWKTDSTQVLDIITEYFAGERVIVRSSALQEDSPGLSYAGYFKSEIAGSASDRHQLALAIDRVVSSYSRDGRAVDPMDQFIIQRHVEKVLYSGVILTRDWPNLAPYYVIDFDDETGRTDTVTQGLFTRQLRIARWSTRGLVPERWRGLMSAVREIEKILAADSLQLEFAIDLTREIHIFQVRSLMHPGGGSPSSDQKVKDLVNSLQRRLHRLSMERKASHGRLLLADMSDWNPAEMLGSRCNDLDYSLYRFLITESNWNKARIALGYADASPSELMHRIANKPYIDVETSLLSLTPAGLPPELERRLVDFGLEKISKNPELQDKVEFLAAFSCFDLTFEKRESELLQFGFSTEEVELLRSSLLKITNALLAGGDDLLARQIRLARNLDKQYEVLRRGLLGLPLAEAGRAVHSLLVACRDKGVYPFAQVARMSFVGLALLRSIAQSTRDESFVQHFLSSVETIAGRMSRDFGAVYRNQLSNDKFLRLYGHLRPGTYNILMPRLDQIENIFENVPKPLVKRTRKRYVYSNLGHIDDILRNAGLVFSSRDLLGFAAKTLRARELLKFKFTQVLSGVIESVASIGSRLGFSRADMALLDIDSFVEGASLESDQETYSKWKSIITDRRNNRRDLQLLALPPVLADPVDLTYFEHYKARPNFVSRSRAEGPIAILAQGTHRNDPGQLQGRVVLVENADPGYDWLFSCNIAGLITKYGGVASHMAIRCGEFGLPAAIGCGEIIFNNICKGTRVCIDGQAEAIFVI